MKNKLIMKSIHPDMLCNISAFVQTFESELPDDHKEAHNYMRNYLNKLQRRVGEEVVTVDRLNAMAIILAFSMVVMKGFEDRLSMMK